MLREITLNILEKDSTRGTLGVMNCMQNSLNNWDWKMK
jgi:hypothetical protein